MDNHAEKNNNLSPEEQKGNNKESFICKYQLMNQKAITKFSRKKKKSLRMAWIDYQNLMKVFPTHGS